MTSLNTRLNTRLKYTVFNVPYEYTDKPYQYMIELDDSIIPNSLKDIVNNQKDLAKELFKVENIKFRNSIIDFAEKMKVAMNFRANNKMGTGRRVPWKATKKKVNFQDMANLFYFLCYPISKYNKILTAAVNINRSLKLQLQFADNNRFYCPRYKIENSEGGYVPFFNIWKKCKNGHRLEMQNNVARMLLGGPEGLSQRKYKIKYQPGCRWWGMLPLPQDASSISGP